MMIIIIFLLIIVSAVLVMFYAMLKTSAIADKKAKLLIKEIKSHEI